MFRVFCVPGDGAKVPVPVVSVVCGAWLGAVPPPDPCLRGFGVSKNFAGSSAWEIWPLFAMMSSWRDLNSGMIVCLPDICPTVKCLNCRRTIQRTYAMVVLVIDCCALSL